MHHDTECVCLGNLAFPKGLSSAAGRPRVPPSSPVVFDVELLLVPGRTNPIKAPDPLSSTCLSPYVLVSKTRHLVHVESADMRASHEQLHSQ